MKQTDFAYTLTKFLSEYLPGRRNVSPNTIRSYRDTYRQLIIFLHETYGLKPERIIFSNITPERVIGFLRSLEEVRGVSINTRNQRLAAIHSFYRYAQTEYPDILFESQRILGIPFKKRNLPTVGYLSRVCLSSLLAQPDSSTKRGRRDLTLITMLYDTGARVQELIDLKVCDVRLQEPAIVTLTGKGSKSRCVPLMEKTLNRKLEDYDIIAGTFIVCGLGEEDFDSLTPELAEKYREKFADPEIFMKMGSRIVAIPIKPKDELHMAKPKQKSTEPEL